MGDPATTPYQQAVFAQEQLEKLYETLCKQLWPYRPLVSIFQNALMFRQSHVLYSLVIFVFVHAAFVWYVRTGTGFIGILANLLFLYFLLDLLWYAASYKERKQGSKDGGFTVRPPARFTALEQIILRVEKPRDAAAFTYEEVCFLFAKRWNWFNMLWMALRHWNREDPLVFSCILGTLGMILISIGWYIPGVVLSYCIIMGLLLWPYIEHHQLHFKILGYLAVTIAKVINKAVRWVAQMKEYAEDDTDIGTTVAALDDGFENDLGSKRRPSAMERRAQMLDSRMDSFLGPAPIYAGVDPLQSLMEPSLCNVDLDMSLMPPIRRHSDHDDEATINDAPSLSEDFGNYDSHEENDDDTFPELNFAREPVIRGPSNLITSTSSSVNTSTPVDPGTLPEEREYRLPSYDDVMKMDSLNTPTSSDNATHYYPDESQVTHRYKDTT